MHIRGQPKIGCNSPRAMWLLRLCLCPKMASFKIFLGKHAPRPPTLVCLFIYTFTTDTHVTSLLKILATGLKILVSLLKILATGLTQFYAFILYRLCIFPSHSFPTSLLSYHSKINSTRKQQEQVTKKFSE